MGLRTQKVCFKIILVEPTWWIPIWGLFHKHKQGDLTKMISFLVYMLYMLFAWKYKYALLPGVSLLNLVNLCL